MAAAAAYKPPVTMSSLRDYVAGADGGMQQLGDTTVVLFVTHNHLNARFPEIRLELHMTVDALKAKIHTMCGTSVSTMVLQLRDEGGAPLATLSDDARKLGFYSPHSGMTLHVVDTDDASLGAQGWLEDVSKVEKYVMSDEDYAARDNTYRSFKAARLAADPTWTLEKEMAARAAARASGGGGAACAPPAAAAREPADDDTGAEAAASIAVGGRCSVDPGDRRGTVEFVGRVPGLAPGFWVGVRYDEPLGKNDGAVGGARYFACAPRHGGFVRPDKVSVGDYPPADDGLSSSDLGSDDEI